MGTYKYKKDNKFFNGCWIVNIVVNIVRKNEYKGVSNNENLLVFLVADDEKEKKEIKIEKKKKKKKRKTKSLCRRTLAVISHLVIHKFQ